MESQDSSKLILEETLYGTQNTTLTWEEEVQEFKRNYRIAMNELERNGEPTQILQKISQFFEVILEDPQIVKESKEFCHFFYDGGVPGIISKIVRIRTTNAEVRNGKEDNSFILLAAFRGSKICILSHFDTSL